MKMYYNSAMVLALLAAEQVSGFVPPMRTSFQQRHSLPASSMVETAATTSSTGSSDVSIPYDAAARLAYDEWRAQYSKGAFDAKRFESFKKNYETITIANVVAKKKAREDATVSLSLMTLNEFGDLSEQEYKQAVQKSGGATTTTGDVLSKALEAAELQKEASNALGEAADALAEEEQKLMEKLGLLSLEELEVALDSLEGIAPDGGELETSNIAREARVREAYLNWCKEYRKKPDESRFPTFSNNFLMMEQYAKESAKEMTLNQYADYTKEEYEAMQSGATKAKAAAAAAPVEKERSGIEKALEKAAKAAIEAKEMAAKSIEGRFSETGEKSVESAADQQARLKAIAEEQARAEKQAAEARAKRAAEVVERAKQEAERRKEIEQQRAERDKALSKEAEKLQNQAEAAAIAAAKRQAEIEATRAAQRAYFDAQAAKQARETARKWDEQQRKLKEKSTKSAAPKAKKQTQSIFATMMTPKKEEAKMEDPKIQIELDLPTLNLPTSKPAASTKKENAFASFFAPKSESVAKPTPKPTPAPKKATVVKKQAAPTPAFSFFSSPSPQPAKKPVVVVAPKPSPTPAAKSSPAPAPMFSFFSSPTPTKAKAVPPPVPAPVVKAPVPSPGFSFFSAPKPVEKKPVPAPVVKAPAPAAPAKSSPTFSLFGSLSPAKKEPTPKPKVVVKVPAKAGTISLFPSKAAPQKDIKVPNRAGSINVASVTGVKPKSTPVKASPTFNLFGSQNVQPKAAAVPTPKKQSEPVSRSPTFSLFGSPPPKKVAPEAKKPDIKVPNRAGTIGIPGANKNKAAKTETKPAFSFFGGGAAASIPKSGGPADVPVLSRWKQNPDGSITGKVSNSKGFRAGTEITTSPVRKGAKGGTVVKTGSGSQYYLS